jgi:hypothetical protein
MIYSLTAKRPEDVRPGEFGTGVVRFVGYLRQVFPDLVAVRPESTPFFTPGDIVIADNHLSLLVPAETPTIVVHHGCAQTHWQRDETWRTPQSERLVDLQEKMFTLPNRTYVAPSAWVRDEFVRHYDLPAEYAEVIVNWVPVIAPIMRRHKRPVVIGDWRDFNKGATIWQQIAALMPGCDFRPCNFRTDAERIAFYQNADLYLCLSLSEGGSYSMCDAEAAGLQIVSTLVGNAEEFTWHPYIVNRTDAASSARTIEDVICEGQMDDRSFFGDYPFTDWAAAWRSVVERARAGRAALQ